MTLKHSQKSEIKKLNILLFAEGIQIILLATPSIHSKASAQTETMLTNQLHSKLPLNSWCTEISGFSKC